MDIETMEAVWKDITMLRSVRGFVEWLQEHPEVIVLNETKFLERCDGLIDTSISTSLVIPPVSTFAL